MVFSIDKWMEQYINVMQNEFHDRIWFLGLQGSYGRGEAGDQSDIDVVIILDTVSASDLETYATGNQKYCNGPRASGAWIWKSAYYLFRKDLQHTIFYFTGGDGRCSVHSAVL